MFAPVTCFAALLLVACSNTPTKPAICDEEYAGTVMACAKPKVETYSKRDYVEVCQIRSGHRQCYLMRRDELRDALRDLYRR